MDVLKSIGLTGAVLVACAACDGGDYSSLYQNEGRTGRAAPKTTAQPPDAEEPERPPPDLEALSRAGYRSIETVSNPGQVLPTMDVRDRDGRVIGVVSAVQTKPAGAVEELVVVLDEGKTLHVTPPYARYDDGTDSVRLIVAVNDLER